MCIITKLVPVFDFQNIEKSNKVKFDFFKIYFSKSVQNVKVKFLFS